MGSETVGMLRDELYAIANSQREASRERLVDVGMFLYAAIGPKLTAGAAEALRLKLADAERALVPRRMADLMLQATAGLA